MTSKHDLYELTRREFMQGSLGVSVSMSCGNSWSAASELEREFEHGAPLFEVGYGDVAFAEGLCSSQLEQTNSVLMEISEDSLLRPFRLAAGMPAPGSDLGGWYSSPKWGPTTFGQWLSALSRYYAITKDERCRDKVRRLVLGFSESVEPTGKVYKLSQDYELVPYSYDKIVCGLVDAKKFADIPEASNALEKTTIAALRHLPGKAIDFFSSEGGAGSGESYTLPENQFLAFQRGAALVHLDLARAYLHESFFSDLADGRNTLAGRHAYSHVNALCSAAKAYLVLGDKKYLKAAVNGMAFVEQQSFVTGGWGPDEQFLPHGVMDYGSGEVNKRPIRSRADSIEYQKWHFETGCGSYAHFKLARYLLRITKDPKYGDSMERVMYNAALGMKPLNKFGKAFYYSNYHSRAQKTYYDGNSNIILDEWPCCSGTLPQLAADYRISSYFKDRLGIFVNLFIPSTVRWKQSTEEVSLSQSSRYPLDDRIAFEVTASRPVQFAIRLRIPAWAKAPSIRVNGSVIPEPVPSGTFAAIWREWKSGDRIDLALPRQLTLRSVDPEHPDLVALVCEPLVLFSVAECAPQVTRAQLLAADRRVPTGEEWFAESATGGLRLLPWWAIEDEAYTTYIPVNS